MPSTNDQQLQIFAKYLSDKRIVIADTASGSRAGLAKTMIDLGAKTSLIALAPSYEVAEDAIVRLKPHVVICDYDLGKRCGLELLQKQRTERPESKDCLFVLVTGNTSQSAVAQAAEEDIDTFVLKPYTIDMLRNSIMKAAINKLNPSEYLKTIDDGKKLLLDGKYDESMEIFEKATKMDPKPALAYFYHGQAELMKKSIDSAVDDYNKGLHYNKIHYKCLVGLYDAMMKKKLHADAYEVVKKISRYFPANPQRLAAVLRLAIMTKSYEDIEKFYQSFTGIDQRTDELIRYVCAALVVTGKFYLQGGFNGRALELFQKAATTAGGRTKILREVVTALIEFGMQKDAMPFLERFPAAAQNGEDYLAMKYLISDTSTTAQISIDLGQKLIQNGTFDPVIYSILIRRYAEIGKKEEAESLAHEAAKKWPPQKEQFLRIASGSDSADSNPQKAA